MKCFFLWIFEYLKDFFSHCTFTKVEISLITHHRHLPLLQTNKSIVLVSEELKSRWISTVEMNLPSPSSSPSSASSSSSSAHRKNWTIWETLSQRKLTNSYLHRQYPRRSSVRTLHLRPPRSHHQPPHRLQRRFRPSWTFWLARVFYPKININIS